MNNVHSSENSQRKKYLPNESSLVDLANVSMNSASFAVAEDMGLMQHERSFILGEGPKPYLFANQKLAAKQHFGAPRISQVPKRSLKLDA